MTKKAEPVELEVFEGDTDNSNKSNTAIKSDLGVKIDSNPDSNACVDCVVNNNNSLLTFVAGFLLGVVLTFAYFNCTNCNCCKQEPTSAVCSVCNNPPLIVNITVPKQDDSYAYTACKYCKLCCDYCSSKCSR